MLIASPLRPSMPGAPVMETWQQTSTGWDHQMIVYDRINPE
jgi:hypothetical protein